MPNMLEFELCLLDVLDFMLCLLCLEVDWCLMCLSLTCV